MPPSSSHQEFISTKEAAKLSGYSADYLARLARAGEVRGMQSGRAWLVDPASVTEYLRVQEDYKRERLEALAHSRVIEYQTHQGAPRVSTPAPLQPTPTSYAPLSPRPDMPEFTFRQEFSQTRAIRAPSARSQVGALVAACAVVTTGVLVGHTTLLPSLGGRVITIAEQSSYGLHSLLEPVSASIVLKIAQSRTVARDAVAHPTPQRVSPAVLTNDLAVLSRTKNQEASSQVDASPIITPLSAVGVAGRMAVRLTHSLIGGEVRLVYAVPTFVPELARLAVGVTGQVGLAARRYVEVGGGAVQNSSIHVKNTLQNIVTSAELAITSTTNRVIASIGYKKAVSSVSATTHLFLKFGLGIENTLQNIVTSAKSTIASASNRVIAAVDGVTVYSAADQPNLLRAAPLAAVGAAGQEASSTPSGVVVAEWSQTDRGMPPEPGLPVVVAAPISAQVLSYGDIIDYDQIG